MESSKFFSKLTVILSNLLTLSKFSILFLCLLYSSFLYWVISIGWFLSLSLSLFVHVSSSGFWCSPSIMGYVSEGREHECGHRDQRYMVCIWVKSKDATEQKNLWRMLWIAVLTSLGGYLCLQFSLKFTSVNSPPWMFDKYGGFFQAWCVSWLFVDKRSWGCIVWSQNWLHCLLCYSREIYIQLLIARFAS
jgi:hypothetical protein